MFQHLNTISKYIQDEEYKFLATEKLKHINFNDVLIDYITNVLFNIEHVRQYGNVFFIDTHEHVNEQCKELCDSMPLFCSVCMSNIDSLPNIVQCLMSYTQEDFEDGVEWMHCLYNCE